MNGIDRLDGVGWACLAIVVACSVQIGLKLLARRSVHRVKLSVMDHRGNSMFSLAVNGSLFASIAPVDASGNPYPDMPADPSWTVSDAEIVSIAPAPGGYACSILGKKPGKATLTASIPNTAVSESLELVVTSGQPAAKLNLSVSPVSPEQPGAVHN